MSHDPKHALSALLQHGASLLGVIPELEAIAAECKARPRNIIWVRRRSEDICRDFLSDFTFPARESILSRALDLLEEARWARNANCDWLVGVTGALVAALRHARRRNAEKFPADVHQSSYIRQVRLLLPAALPSANIGCMVIPFPGRAIGVEVSAVRLERRSYELIAEAQLPLLRTYTVSGLHVVLSGAYDGNREFEPEILLDGKQREEEYWGIVVHDVPAGCVAAGVPCKISDHSFFLAAATAVHAVRSSVTLPVIAAGGALSSDGGARTREPEPACDIESEPAPNPRRIIEIKSVAAAQHGYSLYFYSDESMSASDVENLPVRIVVRADDVLRHLRGRYRRYWAGVALAIVIAAVLAMYVSWAKQKATERALESTTAQDVYKDCASDNRNKCVPALERALTSLHKNGVPWAIRAAALIQKYRNPPVVASWSPPLGYSLLRLLVDDAHGVALFSVQDSDSNPTFVERAGTISTSILTKLKVIGFLAVQLDDKNAPHIAQIPFRRNLPKGHNLFGFSLNGVKGVEYYELASDAHGRASVVQHHLLTDGTEPSPAVVILDGLPNCELADVTFEAPWLTGICTSNGDLVAKIVINAKSGTASFFNEAESGWSILAANSHSVILGVTSDSSTRSGFKVRVAEWFHQQGYDIRTTTPSGPSNCAVTETGAVVCVTAQMLSVLKSAVHATSDAVLQTVATRSFTPALPFINVPWLHQVHDTTFEIAGSVEWHNPYEISFVRSEFQIQGTSVTPAPSTAKAFGCSALEFQSSGAVCLDGRVIDNNSVQWSIAASEATSSIYSLSWLGPRTPMYASRSNVTIFRTPHPISLPDPIPRPVPTGAAARTSGPIPGSSISGWYVEGDSDRFRTFRISGDGAPNMRPAVSFSFATPRLPAVSPTGNEGVVLWNDNNSLVYYRRERQRFAWGDGLIPTDCINNIVVSWHPDSSAALVYSGTPQGQPQARFWARFSSTSSLSGAFEHAPTRIGLANDQHAILPAGDKVFGFSSREEYPHHYVLKPLEWSIVDWTSRPVEAEECHSKPSTNAGAFIAASPDGHAWLYAYGGCGWYTLDDGLRWKRVFGDRLAAYSSSWSYPADRSCALTVPQSEIGSLLEKAQVLVTMEASGIPTVWGLVDGRFVNPVELGSLGETGASSFAVTSWTNKLRLFFQGTGAVRDLSLPPTDAKGLLEWLRRGPDWAEHELVFETQGFLPSVYANGE